MKVVILAGGLGSRLEEETAIKPKPMVEIGGYPILWHIMKIYSHFGFNEFIICLGYKGYVIKEYFANYFLHNSDVTFMIAEREMKIHRSNAEPWKITLADTGEKTQTGGRLKNIAHYLDGEDFCMTYGDGVANVDIRALVEFHRNHGKLATVTSVAPPGRFGSLSIKNGMVAKFAEKPRGDGAKINGGYFVLSPKVIEYIEDDTTLWEQQPMHRLARENQLGAFEHDGFWQPMDTLRDRKALEALWLNGEAPWKLWT